jgi:hypothetical protein
MTATSPSSVPRWDGCSGWSAEELTSVPLCEFLHPDDQADMVESTDRELIHGPGSRYDCDVRMLCRDVATDTVVWSAELYAMFDLPPDAPPSYADLMQRTHPDDRPLVDQHYRWAGHGRGVLTQRTSGSFAPTEPSAGFTPSDG